MAKKIGIVTINDITGNYGNKLQNYAVVYLLKAYGYEVDTLFFEEQHPCVILRMLCIINQMFGLYPEYKQLGWMKYLSTRKFDKKYLEPKYSALQNKAELEMYDYFVVGSDQVWNPLWLNERKKDVFFLTFAKQEQKVCIAPSFGITEFPEEWEEWYAEHINSFRRISVRELDGASIIKKLTGREATVVIDPTLMLDANEWKKIEERPKKVDFGKKYILTYFLGDKSEQAENDIRQYCERYKLIEYNLQKNYSNGICASNPAQFIYMLEHAELILTDSFHACVFSFLFQRPFQVYKRNGSNMMSRIETFLKTFNLQRKYVDSELENNLFECDYRDSFIRLEAERKKFQGFLMDSIGCET